MSYIGKQLRTQHDNGGRVLIKTIEANSHATIAFIDGADDVVFDDTYDVYEWHLVNLHPATNDEGISFQVNAVDASGFNETTTSSFYINKNYEDGSDEGHAYVTDYDQQQATGYIRLCNDVGNEDEESVSGVLTLYNPANTTFTKHFLSRMNENNASDISIDTFAQGNIDITDAIDEISFKFTSGAIDLGTIYMYGVKKNV